MASQLFRVPELVGEILSYLDMRALMCISTTTRSIYREAIRQLVRNTSPSKPCHLRLLVGWLTRAPCISVSIKNLNIWWKADETPCRAHLMILASHLPRASGLSSLFGDSSTEALLGELSLLDVSNWRHLSQLTLRGVSPNDSRTLALVHCLPSKLRSFAISFREEESDGWRWLNGHQESLLRVSILGARLPEPAPGVFTRTVDLTVSLQHASECLISAFPNLTQLHGKHDGTRTRVYSAVKLQRWTHLRHLRGEWNISSVRSYSLPNLWLDGRLATNFMGVLRMAQQLYPGSLSLFGSIDQISEIDNDNFPRWPRLFEAVSVTAYWKKSDLNMNDFVNDAAVVVVSSTTTAITGSY